MAKRHDQSAKAFLSFLAPAERCNQKCPSCYLTEVVQEPVHRFELTPADFAHFVTQFIEAKVPVGAVMFQGYEVTLPRSWPYLEAVFDVANDSGVPTSFITNGMLLDRWADRIDALDPAAITISLDGADAETNDRLRGLTGAFDASLRSVRSFLEKVPRYRSRLSIASTLYDEDNVRSLREMPAVLQDLGVSKWQLGYELYLQHGRCAPVQTPATLVAWAETLAQAATAKGIAFYTSDEFDTLADVDTRSVPIRRLFDPDLLYRIDPLGYVRSGRSMLEVWSEDATTRWDPACDDAVTVAGYNRRGARPTGSHRQVS